MRASINGNLTHPSVEAVPLRRIGYRVVAPVAWRGQVESADWNDIAALPWIVTPAISSHSAMADQLFDAHGVEPAKRIEADNEAVITSLVVAGRGRGADARGHPRSRRPPPTTSALWRDIRCRNGAAIHSPARAQG